MIFRRESPRFPARSARGRRRLKTNENRPARTSIFSVFFQFHYRCFSLFPVLIVPRQGHNEKRDRAWPRLPPFRHKIDPSIGLIRPERSAPDRRRLRSVRFARVRFIHILYRRPLPVADPDPDRFAPFELADNLQIGRAHV